MRKHELLKEEQEDFVLEGRPSVVAWDGEEGGEFLGSWVNSDSAESRDFPCMDEVSPFRPCTQRTRLAPCCGSSLCQASSHYAASAGSTGRSSSGSKVLGPGAGCQTAA